MILPAAQLKFLRACLDRELVAIGQSPRAPRTLTARDAADELPLDTTPTEYVRRMPSCSPDQVRPEKRAARLDLLREFEAVNGPLDPREYEALLKRLSADI